MSNSSDLKIVVYTKPDCVWCDRAKELLNKNSLSYEEKKYGTDFTKQDLEKLLPSTVKLTTPQIFFNDDHIGGYDELKLYLDTSEIIDIMMGNSTKPVGEK